MAASSNVGLSHYRLTDLAPDGCSKGLHSTIRWEQHAGSKIQPINSCDVAMVPWMYDGATNGATNGATACMEQRHDVPWSNDTEEGFVANATMEATRKP